MHMINPLYSLAGVFVGILVGFTGVGGGSLMTPLLILLFGFHPATAVGTDLLYAAVTKTAGTAVHGINRTVDWTIVRRLAAGSVPATALTLLVLAYAGTKFEATEHVITFALGLALIATAISMVFRRQILVHFERAVERMTPERVARLTVVLGAALGVLVSLSSVGAGAIGMTVLLVLYPKAPINRLVGSDIAHAVPLTLVAGLGHWAMGAVDFGLLTSLLVGSVPGIIVGSLLSNRVPERIMRPILAGTLAIVGGKLIF